MSVIRIPVNKLRKNNVRCLPGLDALHFAPTTFEITLVLSLIYTPRNYCRQTFLPPFSFATLPAPCRADGIP